jgi:hypothetical protein
MIFTNKPKSRKLFYMIIPHRAVKSEGLIMKKSIAVLLGMSMLIAACLLGCTKKEEAKEAAGPVSEEENNVGIANPWVEITEEEADELCTRMFKAPEGATAGNWSKCEALGDPDKGLGPLVQLKFELDGMDFTARAQQGATEDAFISGIYTEWTIGPEDVTLANWGEGNMAGKLYRAVSDSEYTDLIEWYDIEIGIKYSLSVSAKDLDGFDIQAIAEQMYSADNEPDVQ